MRISWQGSLYECDENGISEQVKTAAWSDEVTAEKLGAETVNPPTTREEATRLGAAGADASGACYGYLSYLVSRDLLRDELKRLDEPISKRIAELLHLAQQQPDDLIQNGYNHAAWTLTQWQKNSEN